MESCDISDMQTEDTPCPPAPKPANHIENSTKFTDLVMDISPQAI